MTRGWNAFDNNQGKLLFLVWSTITILLVIAYWPSLHGPLIFDDIQNIVENPLVAIHDLSYASLQQALLSNESGILKRVVPALSFGINHYMAGGFNDTLPFKLTNLLIHKYLRKINLTKKGVIINNYFADSKCLCSI
ncbi:hypothetical protein [Methyloprofundus sp.]|uniref:hypothetical protein n=1 Tax=Methyloprofundus sp. TaxID=2020875 RepID=UPI003D0CE0C6